MKILMLSIGPVYGGAEVFAVRFAAALGGAIRMVCLCANAELHQRLLASGVTSRLLPGPRSQVLDKLGYYLGVAQAMQRTCDLEGPFDLIILNGAAEVYPLIFARRLHHESLLFIRHSDLFSSSLPLRLVYVYLARRHARRVVTFSPPSLEALSRHLPEALTECIPHWAEALADLPRLHPGVRRPLKVCYVSRLTAEKGWRDLFEAVRRSARFTVDFLGDGPDLPAARALAKSCLHAQFLGFIQDPPSHLRKHCDVYVFTSRREVFPLALLEAAAAGLPCIAVDTPVTRHVLGEGGLYYASLEGLTQLLHRLADEPALYNEMAGRALDRARRYARHGIIETWLRLLATLAAPRATDRNQAAA